MLSIPNRKQKRSRQSARDTSSFPSININDTENAVKIKPYVHNNPNMKNKTRQKNKVPEGWNFKTVESFAKTSAGGTPRSTEESYYKDGDIPWVNSGEVRKGRINKFDNFITKTGLENSSAKLFPEKTVLIAMYGATAGQVGYLEQPASTNQAICGILPNETYDSDFILHFFSRRKKHLLNMGSGAAQPNISQEIIRTYDVLLPPLEEQKRIVGVLEVWDQVVEKLQEKIAIKKNIKRGLMQQLLTGQKRLPGFSDEWKNYEIGQIMDYEQPAPYIVTSTNYSNEYETPVLTAGKSFILGYTDELDGICKELPVVIFDDFTTANKYVDFPFKVKSSAMKLLRPKNNFNLKYIFERMQLTRLSLGEHKRKYISEYQFIVIKVPPIEEQNAIAKILFTADREIELLEQKLATLQQQRTYLLNNLVTGAIRTPADILTT